MSDHSDVERLGVTLAQLQFTTWRWIFREQPLLDYGIDAHVEPKRNGVPSGRPIALQIKTGLSYFVNPTADGWLYRGRDHDRHLRYWLGHTLPVLIVLCDECTNMLYWQHVTPERVNYTANDWTIVIPRSQTITPDAMDELWAIAHSADGAVDDPLESTMPLLPPSVVDALHEVAASEPRGTLRLAVALSRGRHEPRLAIQTILTSRPSWLERGRGRFEAVLGAYAGEHGLPDLATQSLTRAAEQVTTGRGRLCAMAAMFAGNTGDLVLMAALIQQADELGDVPLLAAAARLALQWLEGNENPPVPQILRSASAVDLANEPTCLLVLGDEARRRQDIAAALRFAEAAAAAMPRSSAAEIRVAEMLLWRVSAGSSAVPSEDLRRAEDLANTALMQRRRWAGPSAEAVALVLRKHMLTGAYKEVLHLATPEPVGEATEREATDGNVAYLGAQAALALGERDKAVDFVDRLAGTPLEAGLRALVADPELPRDEQIRLWREALRTAMPTDLCIRGLYCLASLGAWPMPELDELRQSGVIDPTTADIIAARGQATRGDVPGAVAELRRHASTSAGAAETLVEVLEDDGQYDLALQECVRGIELFGESVLDAKHLNLLLRTERRDAAADWAIQLLSRPDVPPERRLALRQGLIGLYTMRRNWTAVESHSRAALGEFPGHGDFQWALVGAAYSQRRLDDAWERFQQLNPTNTERRHLNLWMGLHVYFGFSEADIATALDNLERWPEDAELGAKILGSLLLAEGRRTPNGDPILPNLDAADQRRIQDALQSYTVRHPDGPIRAVHLDGRSIAEIMRDQLAPTARQTQYLSTLVQHGRIPLGLLAASRGRPYAQALVERACGPLIAVTTDPARFEREVAAARAARGQSIVVETSALVISTLVPNRWPILRGTFVDIIAPRNVLHDIQTSTAELRRDADSHGYIGLDPDTNTLVRHQPSEQQTTQLNWQITDVEAAARDLVVIDTPDRTILPNPLDYGDREVWISPLELAAQTGLPLWSDDVVVRELAVEPGVATFGTLALLQGLMEDELVPDTLRSDVKALARSYIVDLTLTSDELLEIAGDEHWQLGAATAQVRRAAFWEHYESGITDCLPIFDNVHRHAPICWPPGSLPCASGSPNTLRPQRFPRPSPQSPTQLPITYRSNRQHVPCYTTPPSLQRMHWSVSAQRRPRKSSAPHSCGAHPASRRPSIPLKRQPFYLTWLKIADLG